jgi:hypothetical protein|tara:strand:+ start:1349 stop:1594 length:246 start_codon:yes stop_codon:yes gene_type:complete
MKSKQELIEDGLYNDSKGVSYTFIASFYVEQLKKFRKLGVGKMTENNVWITPGLIEITEERLNTIRPLVTYKKKGEQDGTV